MDNETDYRIEFTIQRRKLGEDDFTEIGFGSSGAWSDLDGCAHWVSSGIQNGEWETEPGHPDPSDVMREMNGE